MRRAIPAFGNATDATNCRPLNHGAGQAMFPDDGEIGWLQQVNGGDTHVFGGGAEVIEIDFAVTPATDTVIDIAFELGRGNVLRPCQLGQNRGRGGDGGGFDKFSAGHGRYLAMNGLKIKALQPFQRDG